MNWTIRQGLDSWAAVAAGTAWGLVACVVIACGGGGEKDCTTACSGRCGAVEGCECPTCGDGLECRDNVCSPSCAAVCEGKCGPVEGCDCAGCGDGLECVDNVCVSTCESLCQGKCGLLGDLCSCGGCGDGLLCEDGVCVPDCAPDCGDKKCGDDGCGGTCGTCEDGWDCVEPEGVCTCEQECAGKQCGDDGCGGDCGNCPDNHVCLADGTCLCQAKCGQSKCGDDGCGGSCGDCPNPQETCVEGNCVCQPDCEGKQCGPDGCNGDCGNCPVNHNCLADGTCLCIPDCTTSECGSDGCGGNCGSCGCGEFCFDGVCDFVACDGKECGLDGCGGSCGTCASGACVQGLCPPEGQECEDFNETLWDGCTEGDLSEFAVNVFTAGDQEAPAVAMLANGGFVIAWQSLEQDGNSEGVYVRTFGPDGTGGAEEYQVNQEPWAAQKAPAVAGLAAGATPNSGGFVAAWASAGQDTFLDAVYARLFAADGTPAGDEFQVNEYFNFNQTEPAVAALPDGFVVTWQSDGQDTSETGVFARRFKPDGAPLGSEFQVNTYILSGQQAPAVSGFVDGRFLLAWGSNSQDGNGWGIFARHFLADGSKDWQEFQANAFDTGHQFYPAIATTGAQTYALAWQSLAQDGDEYGIYVQRFKTPGTKQGSELQVNSTTDQTQEHPAAAGEPGGRFVVAWDSCPSAGGGEMGQDGDGCGIYFQRFKADGAKAGSETRANQYTISHQTAAALAYGEAAFVLAWQSCPPSYTPEQGQDGDGCGVFAARFDHNGKRLYL